MKLLIDENLPKALKNHLPEYEVYTVQDVGWNGKKNGELLALMQLKQFDALITFDKNLRHQQNFEKYPIAVLLMNALGNAMPFLRPLVPTLQRVLAETLSPGATVISAEEQ